MKLRMSVPGHERSEAAKVLYSRASAVPPKATVGRQNAVLRLGQSETRSVAWTIDHMAS